MTHSDFNTLQDALLKDCIRMKDTKGKEYAHDDDRLANFKRAAQNIGVDPLMVWYIYAQKHWDAITSYVKDKKEYSNEGIRGRFVDLIVYATLGYGLIKEMQDPTNVSFKKLDPFMEIKLGDSR